MLLLRNLLALLAVGLLFATSCRSKPERPSAVAAEPCVLEEAAKQSFEEAQKELEERGINVGLQSCGSHRGALFITPSFSNNPKKIIECDPKMPSAAPVAIDFGDEIDCSSTEKKGMTAMQTLNRALVIEIMKKHDFVRYATWPKFLFEK